MEDNRVLNEIDILLKCPLFEGLTKEEILNALHCAKGVIRRFGKNEMIFRQMDQSKFLYILLEGNVCVGKTSVNGKQTNIATFSVAGNIFGEVYLFMNRYYDVYCEALSSSRVLLLPKDFLYQPCQNACSHHTNMIYNLLHIMAGKTFYLNQKLRLVSAGTLRQKIATFLLDQLTNSNVVRLTMNRDQLAQYLNVTRPSLSRELIRMQEDGFIVVKRNEIMVKDIEQLEDIL